MTERPIPAHTHEVRAILRDAQTQLRRAVKPQPPSYLWPVWQRFPHQGGCPYGVLGDRLWVREAWAGRGEHNDPWLYRATDKYPHVGPWRPSIHMPKAISRITLKLTGVRVERLQAISEEDARAEGARAEWQGLSADEIDTARDAFGRLWDSINGKKCPWESNPWVWVLEFRRA